MVNLPLKTSLLRASYQVLVIFNWLGGRDSNPDSQIQSLESYHWTTSQQRNRIYELKRRKSNTMRETNNSGVSRIIPRGIPCATWFTKQKKCLRWWRRES